MKLIIVRHGETVENQQKIIQGQTHGTLANTGKEQSKKVALRLKNEKIDIIYSSDRRRVVYLTEEIVKFHPNIPTYFIKELRERDYGMFAGKKRSEVNFDEHPEEIETDKQITERVKSFFNSIYKKYSDSTMLFVSHGGVMRCFLESLLNKENVLKNKNGKYNYRLSNASITILDISKNRNKLIVFNSTEHLNKRCGRQDLRLC